MPLYKFGSNDIFRNRVKTHPRTSFVINNGEIIYNGEIPATGLQDTTPKKLNHVPSGFISLHEMNVDRDETNHAPESNTPTMVYPFVTKQGSLTSFKTVSTTTFQTYSYGDIMSSSYPLSSSIAVEHHMSTLASPDACLQNRRHITALRNTFEYYKYMSPHYSWESNSAVGTWNKSTQEMSLVSVPSIFYGSSIKKGTINLKFYVDGSLTAQLQDSSRNGELIQTYPDDSNKGKVAGVILYNEGILALTGSWALHDTYKDYFRTCPDCITAHPDGSDPDSLPDPISPSWTLWGSQGNPDDATCNEVLDDGAGSHFPINVAPHFRKSVTLCPSASWAIDFEGTNYVSVLTMLAHASKGELNHSNNPTYVKHGETESPVVDNAKYIEKSDKEIKNIVKSVHSNYSESFEKTTYISKVGIYDEDKNLIAIAKVATPVKKTEDREYTFKIKMDF
tara:strand:+ start:31 stop:1380 length:1350 start_codon:yes stop_codon:yes gene_type:complete